MLRIEHLSKAYGEKKAVDDLNLHIAPGEIYGFIGHNGAGKTTTLKSVAGILQFDQGEIYVDGKSIRTQPLECKRTFAYIPDNPDLYGGPDPAHRRLFPRHEAEAGHYLRLAAPAQADPHG